LPDGRAHGLLHLDFQSARFESEHGSFTLPLDGAKLELGGASDRLIFLSHPAQPDVTIHTADHSVLEHPVVAATPAIAAQRAKIQRRQRATSLILSSAVVLVVLAVVGVFAARGWVIKVAAAAVPVEWEVKAGDTLFKQVIRDRTEIQDPALTTQLQAITAPLVAGIADKRYPLSFHIVEDTTLNAFAMPGGHVVLHSGLLLAAERPEEVAGVLAHEIAHVTRRHSIRNIISSAGLYLAVTAFIGDASGLLAVLADNSAYLLDRKFSRDFEREADDAGWDYLLRSDIEPSGMITFFQKLQREENRKREKSPVGGIDLEFLNTHPATGERIERLERKWKHTSKQAGYRNIALDYPEFKASLRAKLHAPEQDKP
jgi:predicted Zn-dependent protease